MFRNQVKWLLAGKLLLGLAGAGTGLLAFGGRPGEEPLASKPAGPLPRVDEKADQLKRLAATRLDAAKTAYEGYWASYEAGRGPEEAVHLWSRRWLQAQLDLSDRKAARDDALSSYQERLQKTDTLARARLDAGSPPEFRLGQDPARGVPDPPEDVRPNEIERKRFETHWKAYQAGETSEEQVCLASIRWLLFQNRLRGFDKKVDWKSELQAHLDRIKKVEAVANARFDAGRTTIMDAKTALFFRLQAEEWLAEGKTFEAKDVAPGKSSEVKTPRVGSPGGER
jgi:hypothetical protein